MKVTVLMANHCSATSVSGALEFLECANVLHQHAVKMEGADNPAPFEIQTVSIDGNPVVCTGGLTLTPHGSISDVEQTDLIIVPGFMFHILSVLPDIEPVVPWLQKHYAQDTYIASMCTGAFVTAYAGLLNGRKATTHWIFSEQFRRSFPNVNLHTERTVTDDGLMLCSAGSTTGCDLILHIIRKFASPQLASECSKKLLIDSSERSQTPYMAHEFKKTHQDPDILKAQIWLEKRISETINLEALASDLGLSSRNFIRRFKEATSQTPNNYLQNLRIERAKHLLEASRQTFEQITMQVGYEDGSSFRRLFKERVGLTPSAYRKRFEQSQSLMG